MGFDGDKMFLGWLTRKPSGTATMEEIRRYNASIEFRWMVDAELIVPIVYSDQPGTIHGYVITPKGQRFQGGD